MRLYGMTSRNMAFYAQCRLTGQAEYDEYKQVSFVEVVVSGGCKMWCNPRDLRRDNGEEIENLGACVHLVQELVHAHTPAANMSRMLREKQKREGAVMYDGNMPGVWTKDE